MKLNMRVSVAFVAAGLVTLGLFIKANGSNQTIFKQTETGAAPQGSVQGENLGLPKNLPGDLVFYPGSTLLSSNSSNSNSQISLTTDERVEKVKNFYDLNLLSKGWDSAGNGEYARNNEKLEIEFLSDKENQTVVIINYSFVPTR